MWIPKIIFKIIVYGVILCVVNGVQVQAASIQSKIVYRKSVNIWISGEINGGDDVTFRKEAISWMLKGYYIGAVRLMSSGGNATVAINIGRQIRLMKAATIAPAIMKDGRRACFVGTSIDLSWVYYNSETNDGEPSCTCASACFLIWSGGVGRFGDLLGIHRIAYKKEFFGALSSKEAENLYDKAKESVVRYLTDMNIPQTVIEDSFSYSSADMKWLDKATIVRMENYPSSLKELKLARCGNRPPATARQELLDCEYAIDEEFQRAPTMNYLERYR